MTPDSRLFRMRVDGGRDRRQFIDPRRTDPGLVPRSHDMVRCNTNSSSDIRKLRPVFQLYEAEQPIRDRETAGL